jgi:hypothetical protein
VRYFFDFESPGASMDDDEGCEFASADEMQQAAMKALSTLACEEAPYATPVRFIVCVRDANSRAVYRAELSVVEELLG